SAPHLPHGPDWPPARHPSRAPMKTAPRRPTPTTATTSAPISRAIPRASTDPVSDYARGEIHGRIVAGQYVRIACRRHLRDIEHGSARGLRWDADAALYAIRFFRFLRHSKGEWAGRRFELAPWQAFIVGSVWGWRRADGTRRFRTVYDEVA